MKKNGKANIVNIKWSTQDDQRHIRVPLHSLTFIDRFLEPDAFRVQSRSANEVKSENVDGADASSSTSSISLSVDGAKDSCRTPETTTSCERLAVALPAERREESGAERVQRASSRDSRYFPMLLSCPPRVCRPFFFRRWGFGGVRREEESAVVFDLRAGIICFSGCARAG